MGFRCPECRKQTSWLDGIVCHHCSLEVCQECVTVERYGDRVYELCPLCAKDYEKKYGMLKPHENVSKVRKYER